MPKLTPDRARGYTTPPGDRPNNPTPVCRDCGGDGGGILVWVYADGWPGYGSWWLCMDCAAALAADLGAETDPDIAPFDRLPHRGNPIGPGGRRIVDVEL